mgnify:CR=1 FL=1
MFPSPIATELAPNALFPEPIATPPALPAEPATLLEPITIEKSCSAILSLPKAIELFPFAVRSVPIDVEACP